MGFGVGEAETVSGFQDGQPGKPTHLHPHGGGLTLAGSVAHPSLDAKTALFRSIFYCEKRRVLTGDSKPARRIRIEAGAYLSTMPRKFGITPFIGIA